jgi:amidase
MSLNTIKVPTLEQLGEVAAELGFSFPQADLVAHHDALMPAFEAYNTIDRMPDELPPVTGSHRTPRWRGPDSNHRSRESAWCRRSRSRRLFR